jgi:hypothetical protein
MLSFRIQSRSGEIMAKNEKTSSSVASKASKVLNSASSSKVAKSIAGSALSQAVKNRVTSSRVATKAAKALDDGRSGRTTKSIAGSVLTQKTRQ